ncbi:hypothetical protein MKW98_027306 [Papaver atlanticum]|uniref:BURP domain-containing protein n=1 Tax=Papaver atlanticum TaxID=357466 RepID=A0AAD4SPN0_9MAGN|nr:hypothetical protein MKW98_027306 [Papaver atlanticum]
MEMLLLLISASCLLVSLLTFLFLIQYRGFIACLYSNCLNCMVLQVGVVGNHAAALPSEIYWKNKLPNTLMPTILHELLHPVGSLRPSDNLYDVKYKPKHESLTDKVGSLRVSDNLYDVKYNSKHKSLTDKVGSLRPSDNLYDVKYNQKHKSLTDRIGTLDNLYDVKYRPPLGKPIIPNGENLSAAMNSPGASRFFLEKNLHPGAKMNLHFVVSTASGTTFLPQKLAKVTPFSSSKLPEILNQFNINPKSQKAESISEIILICEKPAMENEEKYCAISLESLVKYGTSKFGKNVNRTRTGKQQYVVGSGVRQIVSDNLVVCHSLPYPYAVFFCHATSAHTAQASVVPLVGADGTKIKATAVCHKDTSKWDPDHVAFQVLKVKPGTVPICHFLTEDTIVWAGKNKEN